MDLLGSTVPILLLILAIQSLRTVLTWEANPITVMISRLSMNLDTTWEPPMIGLTPTFQGLSLIPTATGLMGCLLRSWRLDTSMQRQCRSSLAPTSGVDPTAPPVASPTIPQILRTMCKHSTIHGLLWPHLPPLYW